MASIDALHAILDKAHEGKTPKQLMSLPPSALAGVTPPRTSACRLPDLPRSGSRSLGLST